MKKIKSGHLLVLALSIAAILLGVYYVFFQRKFLPGEFSDARIKGATVAERIVALSRETLSKLDKIAQYDQRHQVDSALGVIAQALAENENSQTQAIQLSSQLTAMAENSVRIQPASAREYATQAVAAEVTLVSRLVYYNTYLTQLFQTLRTKLQRPGASYLDGQVNDLVNKINDEAKAINILNKQFTSSLAQLDAVFGK